MKIWLDTADKVGACMEREEHPCSSRYIFSIEIGKNPHGVSFQARLCRNHLREYLKEITTTLAWVDQRWDEITGGVE